MEIPRLCVSAAVVAVGGTTVWRQYEAKSAHQCCLHGFIITDSCNDSLRLQVWSCWCVGELVMQHKSPQQIITKGFLMENFFSCQRCEKWCGNWSFESHDAVHSFSLYHDYGASLIQVATTSPFGQQLPLFLFLLCHKHPPIPANWQKSHYL